MASNKKNDAQYVNITLNSKEEERDEIVLSMSGVLRQLRRFFVPWFLLAIICGGLVSGFHILLDASSARPVKALVSFNYDGIEKGKNPDGTDFDKATLKSPEVIENALKECNLDVSILESVRQGIVIEPQIPADVLDRITTYAYLYEKAASGSLNAANSMLDETWYSTEYLLKFNYSNTSLKRDEAAELLNEITKQYSNYFIRRFSYNDALGTAIGALDYTTYDYPQAVDMLDDTLRQLRSYVNDLAEDDSVRFRSTVTGYTFADLLAAINSVREIDVDQVSSFITQNNVTKDKDRLQAYYEYRIESLGREQTVYEERLASQKESIDQYEKDSIYIFATDVNTQTTTASEQYDKMIAQKLSLQANLSETIQRIEYYNQRLAVLRKTTVGTINKSERVEQDLANIEAKVKKLTKLVEDTAQDYYNNYSLAGAYNILVPASAAAGESVAAGIKDAFKTVLGLELALLGFYFLIVFIASLREAFRLGAEKKLAMAEAKAAAEKAESRRRRDDDDGEEDDEDDDSDGEEKPQAPPQKNNKSGKNRK